MTLFVIIDCFIFVTLDFILASTLASASTLEAEARPSRGRGRGQDPRGRGRGRGRIFWLRGRDQTSRPNIPAYCCYQVECIKLQLIPAFQIMKIKCFVVNYSNRILA